MQQFIIMITAKELREKYFEFFKEKEHSLIPSASLVPENDPTVLFTTAGMHPLVPYLMGEKHPEGNRIVNVQKCIRTGDINEVGDTTHLTFFEMLGNWSLGDYFKEKSIPWSWEFLTDKKWLGLDPDRLFVTVYEGDPPSAKAAGGKLIPRDDESIALWQECFKQVDIDAQMDSRIFALGREDNWWGPAGKTGPCGPDTEIFYDVGIKACSDGCKPGCSCGKFVEIWNNVFMEYNKKDDETYEPLSQKNVDTGMGVERTLMTLNDSGVIFEIETLLSIIEKVREISSQSNDVSERIVADHVRAATMIMSDGVAPSNIDQGYVVRKLIRRAVRHGKMLGIKDAFTYKVAEEAIKTMQGQYPEVKENKDLVLNRFTQEEEKFRKTLEIGLKKFNNLVASEQAKDQTIDGKDAFDLFQTYGFPLEMTQELAQESELSVDEKGFYEEFNKHQDLSRTATAGRFKGGLADASETTTKYHTANHLLLASLKEVLGGHVSQKGSNITAERLRFDFNHPDKMTDEEIKKTEDLVNAAIKRDYPVSFEEMTLEEAKARGATGVFESRYGERVKVYTIGDPANPPQADPESPAFSKEICGGPHVEHTGVIGKFKIVKEQSASAGVRRIRAVIE